MRCFPLLLALSLCGPAAAQTAYIDRSPLGLSEGDTPAYFTIFDHVDFSREDGVLTMRMHSEGGPLTFSAAAHEELTDAFYWVGRDGANAVVILTGAGGDWMPDVDFGSFGDVSDPLNWSLQNDEGRILENIANIRAPVICAVEGRAWVHAEYCLMSDVVVAAEGATLHDAPHFAGGIVPGDGTFTVWAYRMGPGRATAFLLDPEPIRAADAQELGLVNAVVPDGMAVGAAQDMVRAMIDGRPLLTLRNTRIHFIQPLKERLVDEVSHGLSLEGASAAALVQSLQR